MIEKTKVINQPRVIKPKTSEINRESLKNSYRPRPSRGGCGCGGNGGK